MTPTPLPKPKKRVMPKVSVAARIERGYYEDLVRIIDADDHYDRLGDFVREAVLEKVDRWKRDRSPQGIRAEEVGPGSVRYGLRKRPGHPTTTTEATPLSALPN